MSTSDRWSPVEALYHAARGRAAGERAGFLDGACGGDADLQHEIESLLAQPASGDAFLGEPALAAAAQMISNPGGLMLTGRRIGVYQVQTLLGAGGMGEVYRARDTKLGRDVAIKILPKAFMSDPDRLGRFEREARMLAALNHPHIGAIYGVEEADDVRALVLELVEGQTLAEKIAGSRGPGLPLPDALRIASEIADALDAAHEKGIIHRDLKPANVKITPDGIVKVLDFGLAKTGTGGDDVSAALTMEGTREGVVLGTAAYMSPEQARGQAVDKRTDIWAFGCVLYEMLTGHAAFARETVSDTIAAILNGDPGFGALPPTTPATIRSLLRRTLEKDPKRRLHDIADARLELEGAGSEPERVAPSARPVTSRTGERVVWGAAVVALAALATTVSVRYLREPATVVLPETRTEIDTPATSDPISFALSPDGRQIVFVASGDGPSRLWLRSLAATSAQPLPGTDGAAFPFWSPDSRSVAFFADGKLKRLDLGSGRPQTLANAVPRGGTWNADGVLLYAPTITSPLFHVSASGGQPAAVTTLDRQISHRLPAFLPDGHHFLFYAQGTPDTSGIYLGSLDVPDTTRLTAADTGGVYLPSGRLAWVKGGTLVAQRLDLTRRELAGDLATVADTVTFDSGSYAAAFSVSGTNLMAYRSGAATRRQLGWFDRSGKALGVIGAPDENGLRVPRLSRDGRRVLVFRTVQGNTDLWLLDETRMTRLTFDTALDRYGTWSPDGNQIVFDSNRKGQRNLYLISASNAGTEQLLLESPQDKGASDWSADERFILYSSLDPQTGWDLWVMPIGGDRKPRVFLKTAFAERQGVFSPDGRWVAYESNESGQQEIYIRPFIDPASAPSPSSGSTVSAVELPTGGPARGRWQVSTAGGNYPRWRPDGEELFYIGSNGEMMAAPIMITGAALQPGTPVKLFDTRIYGGGVDNGQGRNYDVSRDGRFLINTALDDAAAPITLIQNWNSASQR